MTPSQTEGIRHQKYPTYVHCSITVVPPSPKLFVSFALRTAVFEIFHILGFPLTPMLNFKVQQVFLIFWQIAKIYITLYSPMTGVFLIKVWPRLDENCRRSSVLKFPAPYGSVLTKNAKCHKIFKFWQIAKSTYSLNSLVINILTIKFGCN